MNEVLLDNLIKELVDSGSTIDEAKIKNKVKTIIFNNQVNNFLAEIRRTMENYKNNPENEINHISITIVIKDYKINFNSEGINEHTLFDIASITKLFTLKLIYEFIKEGKIHYDDKINDLCPEFTELNNYTIKDAMKMFGTIETKGKLSSAINKENFIRILESAKILDYSYDSSNYTDIGFVILGYVLESISNLSLQELMDKYIFKPYDLNFTMYNPDGEKYRLLGNGNNLGMPHDYKTRINDGITGAAGLFSNGSDLFKLFNLLCNYEFFDKTFIEEMMNTYFLDDRQRKRSYAGIYISNNDNDISFAPKEYSNQTLGHQGFTGSIVIFDLINCFHISVLVDAIKNNAAKKAENFVHNCYDFKNTLVEHTIVLYLIIVYYSKNNVN
ncbi:MAG: serine hydrolase [Bacilli bacterium]|nr:serine hydrolase [Bacilli bacterium]MDD4808827.1 serine hydrolase [Bacilli bacterium]